MFYCDNYALAVFFCFVTMLCWGSWGNTQKLAGKSWRYEFFYWDYVLGVLLFALVFGLLAGSWGPSGSQWSFLANLRQAAFSSLVWAFCGGVVFNAANILLSAAISIAGMSVAFPVGIGLSMVLGVVWNYVGKQSGNPVLLFGGVVLISAAIVCNALASKSRDEARPGESSGSNLKKGLVISLVCGLLMSLFYYFVARSMDMNFSLPAPQAGKLTPYTAQFVFAIGIFLSTFLFNGIAMAHPVSGEPARPLDYFRQGTKIHLVGMLGGIIWGLGSGLNFVAAGTAGPAISYGLGQGAILVSALWGFLIWKEFAGAPKKAIRLNLLMFLLFLAGLAMIIVAGK